MDSLSTAQTVGGTHRGNKQYNTILQSRQHSNIPPAQVQRSDSATYQPRLCALACALVCSLSFPLFHSLFYILTVSLSNGALPVPSVTPLASTLLYVPPFAHPHRSHRRARSSCRLRSIAVPSPFHLVERLYLIGWIINHR